MQTKTLRAQAEQYRSAAQRLYDDGLYVTSKEAATLAGLPPADGYRHVNMAERRGTLANRGVATFHLYDVVDVIARWPKGPGAVALEAGGIDAVRAKVQELREA